MTEREATARLPSLRTLTLTARCHQGLQRHEDGEKKAELLPQSRKTLFVWKYPVAQTCRETASVETKESDDGEEMKAKRGEEEYRSRLQGIWRPASTRAGTSVSLCGLSLSVCGQEDRHLRLLPPQCPFPSLSPSPTHSLQTFATVCFLSR